MKGGRNRSPYQITSLNKKIGIKYEEKGKQSQHNRKNQKKTMLQHHFEIVFVTEHTTKRHILESNVENPSNPHVAN
jgi:hypothetical protein